VPEEIKGLFWNHYGAMRSAGETIRRGRPTWVATEVARPAAAGPVSNEKLIELAKRGSANSKISAKLLEEALRDLQGATVKAARGMFEMGVENRRKALQDFLQKDGLLPGAGAASVPAWSRAPRQSPADFDTQAELSLCVTVNSFVALEALYAAATRSRRATLMEHEGVFATEATHTAAPKRRRPRSASHDIEAPAAPAKQADKTVEEWVARGARSPSPGFVTPRTRVPSPWVRAARARLAAKSPSPQARRERSRSRARSPR
jgi:hypothetical protein